MSESDKARGILFGFLFCTLSIVLSLINLIHPSWFQTPQWIVYLIIFIALLMGLICIAATLNWQKLRNILIFVLTLIFGGIFGWYAIGFGPRECLANNVVVSGLTCRVPFGIGALMWWFCAWAALSGKIQD